MRNHSMTNQFAFALKKNAISNDYTRIKWLQVIFLWTLEMLE